jgi:hypothetical protein
MARAFRHLRFTVVAAVSASLVIPASANIQQSMDKMFGAMVNVTPPDYYDSQAAGVISGGSFIYRPKVSTIRPMTLDVPRYKVGCNGIDIHAGSFAFISKDAMVNFMRNIASQAIPFAFSSALALISPKIEATLARFQKLAQDMNALTISSCKMTVGENGAPVVNPLKALDGVYDQLSAIGSTAAGMASDAFSAITDPSTSGSANTKKLADAGDPTAQAVNDQTEVNIAWRALSKSDVPAWYGQALSDSDKQAFNEIVMSFTGSVVTKMAATDPDTFPNTTVPTTTFLFPVIDYNAFLNGGINKVWACGADANCLLQPGAGGFDASSSADVLIPSLSKKVESMLLGGAGQVGLVALMNNRAADGATLSVDQIAFVSSMPASVVSQIRRLAINPQAATAYLGLVSNWISVEMTASYLQELIQNVRVSAYNVGRNPAIKQFDDMLRDREKEINQARAAQTDAMRSTLVTFEISNHIRQSLLASSNMSGGAQAPVRR